MRKTLVMMFLLVRYSSSKIKNPSAVFRSNIRIFSTWLISNPVSTWFPQIALYKALHNNRLRNSHMALADKQGFKEKANHMQLFHRKKKTLLILFNVYQQYFFDKIYTLSNLLLGPKIKIPSTSSYTKLIYCFNIIHSHFLLLQRIQIFVFIYI